MHKLLRRYCQMAWPVPFLSVSTSLARFKSWRQWVPTQCPLCAGAAAGGGLCLACQTDLDRARQAWARRCQVCCLPLLAPDNGCPDCLALTPAFERIISAFDYTHPGDMLIQQFKSGGRFDHAHLLAEQLLVAIRSQAGQLPPSTILLAVPSTPEGLRRRGFNPPAEVARYLSRSLGLPYRHDWLFRVRAAAAQKGRTRAQRLAPGRPLYRCGAVAKGAAVAVVDDVLTTGATMHGIARVLKEAGASKVTGLVLARTPYRDASFRQWS